MVIVTLSAGQEYAAFNPDPITYLLNGMGITTDPKYATKTFAGVVGGNYVLNFRYWAYESQPIIDFENTLIDYFVTDKARLIAPIKSVQVTANNGTEYFIVQGGNVTLEGYDPIKLSSGASYGAGQEDAVIIPTEDEIA